jgi:hypothetical protein
LSACLTDEIMSITEIEQNDSRISVYRNCTRKDLLANGNVLHGGVADVTGLCNSHLLWTTWRVSDVALSDILLGFLMGADCIIYDDDIADKF